MKRALQVLGIVAVVGIIAFLAVSNHLSRQRAARLDKALMEAETRVMELETELQAAKEPSAQPAKATEATSPAVPAPSTATPASAQPATTPAPSGPVLRYASAPGLTNLVRIEGTSSIHDWQVEGHLIGGSAEFGPGFAPGAQAKAQPGPIPAKVSAFIPVRSLKSVEANGHLYSDAMDEIMYGKLLAETNRRITYTLSSLTLKEPPREATAAFLCEAVGELGVAGVTNTITMPVAIAALPTGILQFTGSVKVKMTDFKITPPSPNVGVKITTGDEVTLRFSWSVKPVVTQEAAK